MGVDVLPPLPKDAGDRNRTSPFAFTGNRFEFRAVGSSQSIAGPLVAMNTIVAESLDLLRHGPGKGHRRRRRQTARRGADAAQGDLRQARRDRLQRRQLQRGLAQGSGQARPAELQDHGRRRCRCLRTPEVIELFEKYNVLSRRETESRMDIYLEQYIKTINVEAKLTDRDRQDDDFPGGHPLPGRVGRDLRQLEGRGLHVRHRHARQGDGFGQGIAGHDGGPGKDRGPSRRRKPAGGSHATTRRRSCRPCWPSARRPTSWRASWPTTTGRCRPTRKCCSSSSRGDTT